MEELNKLFEEIHNESFGKITEVAVSTISNQIKRALDKGLSPSEAGHDFGKKYARKPYENSLQPVSNVVANAVVETFRNDNPVINTKLIETVYTDTLLIFKNNPNIVKEYFEAFIEEVKAVGVPFVSSSKLKVN